MTISDAITLVSGIALFLFGMKFMGDGLKKVAGNKLELILFKLSSTPIRSVFLGTGVTAVIQSSTATSVMTVGFVNSGMMKLKQALGVILGSVLGTSVTGWIVCLSMISGGSGWTQFFSTSMLTCIIAVIGIILIMFSKKTLHNHIGMILMGFSVLMIGISLMGDAVSGLKESEAFTTTLSELSNPIILFIFGVIMASILQSASAAVGIVQALSVTGVFTFAIAFPLILGIAIGCSTPVLLSSIGAKTNGKRTAFSFLLINVVGVALVSLLFYVLNSFIHFSFVDSTLNAVSIATVNSFMRLFIVVTLFPFLTYLEKILTVMFKEDENEIEDVSSIDNLQDRLIDYPAIAIEQSRKAINDMAVKAEKNLNRAFDILFNFKSNMFDIIEEKEGVIDKYEDQLGTYLVKITEKELDRRQNREISKFLYALSDFERIGDHAVNISETAKEIYEKKVEFSEESLREISILQNAIKEIVNITVTAFVDEDIETALDVEPLEECVDNLCDQLKLNHVMRAQNGTYMLLYGYIFNDILTNYERIADHCSNIAVAMIELESDELNNHKYLEDLKNKDSSRFKDRLEDFKVKYKL